MSSLSSLIASNYKPKAETIPLIHNALRFYRVTSYITGTFLLLVVLEVVTKYILNWEVELGGPGGIVTFVNYFPNLGRSPGLTGVNLNVAVLIAHGWGYVAYLAADFLLWSRMRWPFGMFILIALGGVVPFLSFITEHFVAKRARRELAELQATDPATPSSPDTMDSVKVSGVEATN
jgi:integral membrane protein